GQLDRVHWQSLPAAPGETPAPARVQAGANDMDPAKLPPFALDIADLKFGKLVLGQAVLRTRTLANGLNVDELRFRAPDQEIDISGRWLGRSGGARTELTAQVRSEDLGGLMQNLDYGGQLRGGPARRSCRPPGVVAHRTSSWPICRAAWTCMRATASCWSWNRAPAASWAC
ncbi:hypothetical protein JR047_21890, partial [Pseudomonas stutzeri]